MEKFLNMLTELVQPCFHTEFRKRFEKIKPALETVFNMEYDESEYDLFLCGNVVQYLIGRFEFFKC